MKKIFLMILSCVAFYSSKAQKIYQKTFSKFYSEAISDFLIKNDSAIYFFGQYNACAVCNPNGVVIKTNSDADILWSYSYSKIKITDALDVGNGIAAFGIIDSFGYSDDYGVVKTDYDGNILWAKRYGTSLPDNGKLILTHDYGYLIAGYVSFHALPDTSFLNFIRLDSVGNIVWQKYFYMGYASDVNFVMQTPDSGFVISGTFREEDTLYSKGYVMRLASNGQIDWIKSYADTANNLEFYTGCVIDTMSFSVCGYYYNSMQTNNQPILVSIDFSGNVNWMHRYSYTSPLSSPYNVTTLSNGNYIMNTGNGFKLLDNSGAYLQSFSYFPTPGQHALIKTIETIDNGLLMAGLYSGSLTNMYIVKTDSLYYGSCNSLTAFGITTVSLNPNETFFNCQPLTGSLDSGILITRDTISFTETTWCETATAIRPDNKLFSAISVYPNPAFNFLNIRSEDTIFLASVTIYNQLGVEVFYLKDINQTTLVLDIKNLTPAMYHLKIMTQESMFTCLKFIKTE